MHLGFDFGRWDLRVRFLCRRGRVPCVGFGSKKLELARRRLRLEAQLGNWVLVRQVLGRGGLLESEKTWLGVKYVCIAG